MSKEVSGDSTDIGDYPETIYIRIENDGDGDTYKGLYEYLSEAEDGMVLVAYKRVGQPRCVHVSKSLRKV